MLVLVGHCRCRWWTRCHRSRQSGSRGGFPSLIGAHDFCFGNTILISSDKRHASKITTHPSVCYYPLLAGPKFAMLIAVASTFSGLFEPPTIHVRIPSCHQVLISPNLPDQALYIHLQTFFKVCSLFLGNRGEDLELSHLELRISHHGRTCSYVFQCLGECPKKTSTFKLHSVLQLWPCMF